MGGDGRIDEAKIGAVDDDAEIVAGQKALYTMERCSDRKKDPLKFGMAKQRLSTMSRAARKLAVSPKLGKVAAELLGRPARLYEDVFFVKGGVFNNRKIKQSFGRTEIHQDLKTAPVRMEDRFLTFWCPLHDISTKEGDSLPFFFPGSHRDTAMVMYHNIDDKVIAQIPAMIEMYGNMTWYERLFDYPEGTSIDAYIERSFNKRGKVRNRFRLQTLSKSTRGIMERYCSHIKTFRTNEANWEAIMSPSFCILSKAVSDNGKKVKRKLKGKHKDMYAQTLEGDTKNIAHWWVRNGGAFDFGEYKLGDCTVHHGWLAHGAPPAPPKKGARTREALVLRYMAKEGFVIAPKVYHTAFLDMHMWPQYSFSRWYLDLAKRAEKTNQRMNFKYFDSLFPPVWPQEGLPYDASGLSPGRVGMPAAPAHQEEGQREGQGEAEDKKTEL